MKNIADIVAHLRIYGWVIFNIKDIAHHIEPVLTGFKKLIAEPDDFKVKWKIHIPELSKKADHGLLPPKGEGFDQKWMLMWRKNLENMLLNGRIRVDEFAPYKKLFVSLDSLFNIGYKNMLQIANEFDKQDPGFNFYHHLANKTLINTHSLRLPEYLYDPSAPDRLFSAQTHVDLGVATIQMLETCKGLVVEGYDGVLVEYECKIDEGTVIVFFGDKMEQLTMGKYPAVPHGVLALAKEPRNSLMLFCHTGHPSREKDGAHLVFDEQKVLALKKRMLAVV